MHDDKTTINTLPEDIEYFRIPALSEPSGNFHTEFAKGTFSTCFKQPKRWTAGLEERETPCSVDFTALQTTSAKVRVEEVDRRKLDLDSWPTKNFCAVTGRKQVT